MRTHLMLLVATLGLASFVTASAAGTGTSTSGGGGGGGAGGGGGGHAAGGGGSHGGGSFGGGGQLAGGYAGSASFAAHGGSVAHGGYAVVGYESAGLGHGDAAAQAAQSARVTLVVGPRAGSAAKATRVSMSAARKLAKQPQMVVPVCSQNIQYGCSTQRPVPAFPALLFCSPASPDPANYNCAWAIKAITYD